jgi:hypothetical protein
VLYLVGAGGPGLWGRRGARPLRAGGLRGGERAGAEKAAHGYRDLLPKFMICARPTPLKSVLNLGTSLPSSHANALSH